MAKKEATLILKIKRTGQKAIISTANNLKRLGASAKKGFRPMQSMIDSMKTIGGVALKVIAPIAAIGGAITALALKASELQTVKASFNSLAASQGEDADKMLAQMKDLSAGTVSELELMKQANNALLLGLPVDRFGDMLTIARSASKATGESMQFMLKSIVTGLGRGSKLMLDNLGILVNAETAQKKYAESLGKTASQLTEAEKKQAFINEALTKGKENADKMGGSNKNLNDRWEEMKARVTDLALEIGTKFIPMLDLIFTGANKALGAVQALFTDPIQSIDEMQAKVKALRQEREKLTNTNTGRDIAQARLADLDAEILKTQELIVAQKKKGRSLEAKKQENAELQAAEAAHQEEMNRIRAEKKIEDGLIKAEIDEQQKVEQQEREFLFQQGLTDSDNQAKVDQLNNLIKNEKDKEKQRDLARKKMKLKEQIITDERKTGALNMHKFEQFLGSEKVKNAGTVLGQISSLQQSKSKELVFLGRAAAMAQITIDTARGVMAAMAMGPLIGPILAPIVVAAGAVNAARVSGVQLAEGGIVQARQGGIAATIGEAGRDEAVIPLDDPRTQERLGGVGGTTINFMGPVTVDRDMLREIDEGLLDLRRDGESVAFEEDFI